MQPTVTSMDCTLPSRSVYSVQDTAGLKVFGVSEISDILKYRIEADFCSVRVRGEVSGLKVAASGHRYFNLKDDRSIINSVCWKWTKLPLKLEDGLEVICHGSLTTYPGRSTYQLTIHHVDISGVGALLALFEQRKQKLVASGIFDEKHKLHIPFLPHTIGIITSMQGAVIRDMLHRISARFPSHVLIWDVPVQGRDAASQIAMAIHGLNALNSIKPDLIIVARGGGSLEDLWAFNEEEVVYAISASNIPVISAIGHETDTTLSDFVADIRAPTPTAAAEFAVPVANDLHIRLEHHANSLHLNILSTIKDKQNALEMLRTRFMKIAHTIVDKYTYLKEKKLKLTQLVGHILEVRMHAVDVLGKRCSMRLLLSGFSIKRQAVILLNKTLNNAVMNYCKLQSHRLYHYNKLLNSYSYKSVLLRGFVVVRDYNSGCVISSAKNEKLTGESTIVMEFHDGRKVVQIMEPSVKLKE